MTLKKIVTNKESERHHFKKWVVEMEAILSANKKNVH
jgi:hypothetical protein